MFSAITNIKNKDDVNANLFNTRNALKELAIYSVALKTFALISAFFNILQLAVLTFVISISVDVLLGIRYSKYIDLCQEIDERKNLILPAIAITKFFMISIASVFAITATAITFDSLIKRLLK
jgi:hypothetical protein